uniref:interleukin-31 receptor subunit alpha-like n=1 Tax=Semicossyphus pulcher TaxID=241346 RepID=UPI0037E84262
MSLRSDTEVFYAFKACRVLQLSHCLCDGEVSAQGGIARTNHLVFMEQRPAVVWTCLLGAAFNLAVSFATSNTVPRPPRLIGCVFLNRANVTCSWEPGDTAATQYTLQVKRIPGSPTNSPLTTFSCTTPGTTCTAALSGSSVRFTFCISVTAHCHGGDTSSQSRCQSGRIEAMLPPAVLNSVKPVIGRPRCLHLTWSSNLADFPVSHPEIKDGKLTSQIQLTAQGQLNVQVQDVTVKDYSFPVCVFGPDTSYSIRLRHRYLGPESPWSPWSNAIQGRTGEDAPSAAPVFWRHVKQTGSNGWRLISLLWQPLPRYLANGRVLFYNITCEPQSSEVLNDHGSCRDLDHASTTCSLLLPAGRCSCALTASTSAGTSPEARIWLLGASETEPPSPSTLTASPLDDRRLDVRWTAPVDSLADGYVVEWFAVREKNSSILHWERLNTSCTALVITEGVNPMERYAVSVKALYGERGAGLSMTVHNYTRQGAPSAGPTVEVRQISGSTVELTWTPVPVELLHGFIRNYTLHFTAANHPSRNVCVPDHAHSYSLRNLSPGNYDIFMQANTDAGAGASGPISNVHIGSVEVSVMLWTVLPLVLTSLVLVLIACLTQDKMMKQKLFQGVPDPSDSSLAHWTPNTAFQTLMQPAVADETEIKYSEVVLLGEIELQNPDKDLTYQSACELQTYCSQLSVSELQTAQHTRKSEKKSIKSSTRAKTTSDTDLSSTYSDVLFSVTAKTRPTPLLSLSHLVYKDWQHTVSVSDVKLQLGGDSEPIVSLHGRSATRSASPLSQTDELKTFLTQKHSSDSGSISLSSISPPHPAEVKSPQHPFSESLYNSDPSLKPDSFNHPDDLCDAATILPFAPSLFVDFSFCPVECGPYVAPAV